MASVHCLLSKLPEDLPFEDLLKTSSKLYERYSLTVIEKEVEKLIWQEKKQRQLEDQLILDRRKKVVRSTSSNKGSALRHWLPRFFTPRSMIVTTALSIVVGICAFYYKNQYPGIS
ncbi:uncharacterized protein LOC115633470 isoform X2 [Scaptodrosophila lebanonensis]|nr:uncharacterized protein LOC115633470 isoform X2 [Scaptodrosophila lebanonensis]